MIDTLKPYVIWIFASIVTPIVVAVLTTWILNKNSHRFYKQTIVPPEVIKTTFRGSGNMSNYNTSKQANNIENFYNVIFIKNTGHNQKIENEIEMEIKPCDINFRSETTMVELKIRNPSGVTCKLDMFKMNKNNLSRFPSKYPQEIESKDTINLLMQDNGRPKYLHCICGGHKYRYNLDANDGILSADIKTYRNQKKEHKIK